MIATNEHIVSVTNALATGWRVAVHHRALVLITALSMTWERSVSLYTQWRGISLAEFAQQYRQLIMQMVSDPLGGVGLRPFAELYGLLAIVTVLFVAGAWVLIGVLGLIRDLLLRDGFNVRHLMHRGGEFLWRMVRFKAPLYLANALAALALLSPAWYEWQKNAHITAGPLVLALLFCVLFLALRIWLSLGPKIIVSLEPEHVVPVYRQVWILVRPSLAKVIVFHVFILLLTASAASVVLGLRCLGLSWNVATVAGLLTAGFMGVLAKAGSFALFLQLAAQSAGRQDFIWTQTSVPSHG